MTILTTEPSKPHLYAVAKHRVWSLPVGGSVWMVMAMLLCLFLMSATPSVFAAQLTLDDGVVVKFGENAQFAVRDRIIPGKAMVFTSAKDDSFLGQIGALPQMPGLGDWRGVHLEKSAAVYGALTLEDWTLRYGGGQNEAALTVRGFSPTFKYLQITDSLMGLRTSGGSAPTITGASFLRNLTGLEALDTSAPAISGSQFVGNSLLAISNQTGTAIQATGNWWGHASGPMDSLANPTGLGDAVTPLGVNFTGFLSLAPLLNPTVRLVAPAPYFDQHSVLLYLGCLNAIEYRIAEGNDFGSQQPFLPLANSRTQLLFTTSNGDGRKSINAQFRDANGNLISASLVGGVLIDTQDPALTLDNPATGSLIRQPIVIEAQASDQAGLAQVQFFLGQQLLATYHAAPFRYYWDTSALADGDYTIKAVATDIAGRSSEQIATVTYSHFVPPPDTDGPTLSNISANGLALADGASFARDAVISFTAGDRSGVAGIGLLLDGSAISTASGGGNGAYSVSLGLTGVANGSHKLTLQAVDSLGNVSTTGFTITVAHVPPPAPVLNQPASGLVTRATSVTVSGSAQPNSTVQLLINSQAAGVTLTAGNDGLFSGMVSLTKGNNRIQATATDPYGTGPASNAVTVTVDLSIPASPGNLTATAQAAGKIRLTWAASNDPNAIGYDLYRAGAAFADLAQASKVNPSPLTGISFDDLPPHDGVWNYRVVSVNAVGTSSDPSNAVSAISDSSLPHAVSILYTPHGKVDPATAKIGQGLVDLVLTTSEAVSSTPYLSIVPQGGAPLTVNLAKSSDTAYTGSFLVDANTASGVANALFSARDLVGNRGTEIDQGATLKLDTAGPALSGITLDPASPINNDPAQTVEATLSFSEPPAITPTVQTLLSGAGRNPLLLDGLVAVDPTTWRGSITLPADAGQAKPETLTFSFQAKDSLDNVSTKVLASNRFQIYQGQLPPLDVPLAFTAKAQPGGKVKLAWAAVDGAASYQLYRQAPGQTSLQPLTRPTGTDYTDRTPQDGSFTYAVASIRQANGQEGISGQSPPVTVIASATAPSAPQNLALQLTGQGIVALWQAPTSGKVASYNLYRATGTGITSTTGLTPLKTGILAPQAMDANPSSTQGAYAVTALDAAGNESPISNSAYLNPNLLPVTNLEIDQIGTAQPSLSWRAPNGNIAGYRVYADLPGADKTPLTASTITALNLTDTGYIDGERNYTVASVDANGVEMPKSLLLPSVQASIVDGLPIQRGVMNQLQVQVVNHSASRLDNVQVVVRLPIDKASTQFKDHLSQSFSLDANQTRQAAVIVGGYADLPSSAQAQVRVEIAPHEGELVKITRTQSLDVVDGSLVVGMSTADFTRGATGKLKLTIENTTDVEVELLTAIGNGQNPSTELRFKLLDADGNVLATQPYQQAVGANVVTLANGLTVVRIPAHSSYVADAFTVNVPVSSPNSLRVRLEVDKLRYHTGEADEITITGRGAEKTVSLLDTAYYGEVTAASPGTSFGDQDVIINGRALDRATQTPLPNTRLKLVLNQQGFERVFSVLTGGDGTFTYLFTPTITDAGLYKVSAVHPDVTDRPEQKSFTINRVAVNPSPYNLNIPKNYPFTIPFVAKSGPSSTATNLRLALNAASQTTGQLPVGITAQLPAPVTLAAQQTGNLPVGFTADNSAQTNGALVLDVVSDEHPKPLTQIKVNYTLAEAKPYLVSTPSFIETGLAQGGSQVESVKVRNQGLQDALNLKFSLTKADGNPAPAWVSLASQSNGTLAIGATRSIDLSFNPPADTPDGIYELKLNVQGDNVSAQSLNVYVSLTQSGQGSVLFKASDIYTATVSKDGKLIPGLASATITVQNENVATVTRNLTTDSLGEALFQNLPAGRYQFRATAANHQEVRGRLQIKPGVTFNQAVFLDYNLITVDWSVREVTIEDRYDIILNATFETDVPAPVVLLQPSSVNLPKMNAGEVFYGELTLTNYGLIRADHVRQQLPQSDAYFRYEFLVDVPSTLEAKQVINIPYRVVALQSLDAAAGSGTASGGGCYNYSNTVCELYDFTCANGIVSSGTVCTTYASGSNSTCTARSSGGGGGGSGGGSGGSGGGGGGWGGWGDIGGGGGISVGGGGDFGGGGGATTPILTKGQKCSYLPRGNGTPCP